MTAFRASSLAAVTIFVWSTMPKPISCVNFRTAWRAKTMSCSERSGRTSLLVTDIVVALLRAEGRAQQPHPPLDVQRGLHAGQAQPQLDERDRDRRPHAHDDRLGVQDPRHPGDVRDHSADERI